MKFYKLGQALAVSNSNDILIAEDINKSGSKVFYVNNIFELDKLYDSIQNKHWYETLKENCPTRLFLDIESETDVVDIRSLVEFINNRLLDFLKCKDSMLKPVFEVLDSSSDEKSSYHVICTNVYFANVYHCGAFVRRVICAMIEQKMRYSDIDASVYTKNRMFRIKGSTKFGSQRILKHNKSWTSLLVQYPQPFSLDVFTCSEIDNTIPCSTSSHPEELFQLDPNSYNGWTTKIIKRASEKLSNSTDCQLLTPVFDWLDHSCDAQLQKNNQTITSNGKLFVSSHSRYCRIKNGQHRGNHVWFSIDLNRRIVYQCCYDAVCQEKQCFLPNSDETRTGKKVISVPSDCWSLWDQEWDKDEPYISNNKSTVKREARKTSNSNKLNSYQGRDHNVYYENDGRNGKAYNYATETPAKAWVVAQWLHSREKGHVLSEISNKYCDQAILGTQNKALHWFISDALRF